MNVRYANLQRNFGTMIIHKLVGGFFAGFGRVSQNNIGIVMRNGAYR